MCSNDKWTPSIRTYCAYYRTFSTLHSMPPADKRTIAGIDWSKNAKDVVVLNVFLNELRLVIGVTFWY